MLSTRSTYKAFKKFSQFHFGGWRIFTPTPTYKQQQRFFSSDPVTHYTQAWSNQGVSLPRITHYLKNTNIILPAETTFSIINPNYVSRSLHDLRAIYHAIGTDEHNHPYFRYPSKFIVFSPERTAKHMIAATVATEIQWEDEREFHDICDRLESSIIQEIHDKLRRFRLLSNECEEYSHQFLHQHETADKDSSEFKALLLIKTAVMQRVNEGLVDPSQAQMIIHKIFVDDLLRASYKSEVQNMVTTRIINQLHHQYFTSLEVHKHENREHILLLPQICSDKRFTKFLAGGIATGKSSLAKQFFAELHGQYGLKFGDFAKISTDVFRERLKKSQNIGSDYKIQSSLLHDESLLITDLSFELIQSKLETQGYAPHVFMEAISPADHELQLATHRGGTVRVAVTHFPNPADAVHGNYLRSENQKKYSPPCDAVLNSQCISTKATNNIVKKHSGKNIVMTLHNTYKIIHESSQGSELIAAFFCELNKMLVLDIAEMLNYIKKSHINTKAICPNTVYTNADQTSLPSLAEHFKHDYGHLIIKFIAPNQHEYDIANYEQYAYASYSPESGLVIHDALQFRDLVIHDTSAQELFLAFDADLSILYTNGYSYTH